MELKEDNQQNKILSSQDKYKNEWKDLKLILNDNTLDSLKNLAFNGDLKVSKFRSICWAILLRIISHNPNDWKVQRELQRNKYARLKEEFSRNPHTDPNDDPLSQSKQSGWNQYFGDQELFAVIKQDVIRTFPGVDFFRKPFIQETMTNILFYYAREHPYMVYRQGMHEILAPILFVIFYDQQFLIHFTENCGDIDKILLHVLNPNFLEADSYNLFARVMSSIESYYRITNLVPTSSGYFPETNTDENMHVVTEVEVIGQLNDIRDHILCKEDEHLHNHLLKLEIPLHIFGIRWLRLLFGREFPLLDLLMMWDAIFADSDRFDLPNYILVSMLIRIRDKLLLSDYTTCLTYLMKYPNNSDVNLILKHALHLQMPKKYERPNEAFTYVTTSKNDKSVQLENKNSVKLLGKRNSSSNSRQGDNSGNRSVRSFSDGKINNDTEPNLSQLQYTVALNAIRMEKIKALQKPGGNVIMDGYSEDSPEYLKLELQNAQTVIAVSRLKLSKYLETFRKHITRKNPDDLNQAVDGIEELMTFLDIKFSFPLASQQKVDLASEANELTREKSLSPPISPYVFVNNDNEKIQVEKNENVKDSSLKSVAPNKLDISHSIPNSPKKEIVPSNSNAEYKFHSTKYEMPDVSFMENSTKLLGRKMNVELKLFKEKPHDELCKSDLPVTDPLGVRENN